MVSGPAGGIPPETEGDGSRTVRHRDRDPAEEAALAARLERLGEKIEAHRVATDEAAEPKSRNSGFGQAIKIASEFVAGVIVGAGIGWVVDHWLGTSPWALIVFLLLGFAAGVLNVLRAEGAVADAGVRLRDGLGRSGRTDGADRTDRTKV